MQSYWFGDYDDDSCRCLFGRDDFDPEAISGRLLSLDNDMAEFSPLKRHIIENCGCFSSRRDYLKKLREVSVYMAVQKITEYFSRGDTVLLRMVRMLDEIDTVINMLSGRALEWYLAEHPDQASRSRVLAGRKGLQKMARGSSGSLGRLCHEIQKLADERNLLMKEINRRADEVMPNCSALVGGLVAARLLSRAGSLEAISRMSAGTIQVLGAGNALFSHLRSGTPSPKHGIIFQHRRVHNAPREVRGRVARVLATKLAIASRIDFYRGEVDEAFLASAQEKIDRAGVSG